MFSFLSVKCGHVSQAFHIFEFKSSVCLRLAPPPRLMFPHRAPPGSLSSLTADSSTPLSASWASQSIASSSTRPRTRFRCVCQRSSRAASVLPLSPVSWLGRTASPWIRSPPTRAIPTTLDVHGDPIGMGKTKWILLLLLSIFLWRVGVHSSECDLGLSPMLVILNPAEVSCTSHQIPTRSKAAVL